MAVVCTARQTPALIEYLLRKAGLGQEESIPSSGRLDFMSQRTSELTDRRALTFQSFKTPRHQSQAQTAVRCSDLVRRRAQHTQKNLRSNLSRLAVRPGRATAPGTVTANHAKYTKRIRVFRVVRGQKISPPTQGQIFISNLRTPPNVQLSDRRTDVSQPETPRPNPTTQPGSLQRLVRQVSSLKNLRPSLSAKTRLRTVTVLAM